MKRVKLEKTTEMTIKGISGFLKKKVTKFGTGTKVDCPKKYLGKSVYLVVYDE